MTDQAIERAKEIVSLNGRLEILRAWTGFCMVKQSGWQRSEMPLGLHIFPCTNDPGQGGTLRYIYFDAEDGNALMQFLTDRFSAKLKVLCEPETV